MNLISLVFTVLLVSCCIAPPAAAWNARVVYAFEGDILHLDPVSGGERTRVRLYGIDCPETTQPHGAQALAFVNGAVLHKEVLVEEKGRDRYGRVVAVLHLEETTLQELLLDAGLAWFYPRYCRTEECPGWQAREKAARQQRIGLWRDLDKVEKPLAPWKWRKEGR